ncbi:BPT1 [Candida oxycetoniae]|uniref:BPT1 n=1 Tax=Candida oxycetoniae TaxID=497107 RepID=A0AAI9T1E3_9ASCO|nr:BPT1 [Candida oxycetoniae]KAI3406829.2 BPT1 [Candida oxycetoniae]
MNTSSIGSHSELLLGFNPFQLSTLHHYSLLHVFNFLGVGQNDGVHEQSFPNGSSSLDQLFPSPLYSSHGNSINPQFAYFVAMVVSLGSALLLTYKLVNLSIKARNSSHIYKTTPLLQIIKTFAIFVQLVLLAVLGLFVKLPVLICLASTTGLAFLVAQLEFRLSPVPVVASLLFWLLGTFYYLVVLIQDSVSQHKIFAFSKPAYLLEFLLAGNSLAVFILESVFYEPGFDTSNERFMDKVNLFSYITFYFLQPLIDRIYKTDDVKLDDLPSILDDLSCDKSTSKVTKFWEEEKKNAKLRKPSCFWRLWLKITRKKKEDGIACNKPNLFVAIFFAFAPQFFANIALKIIETCLVFTQPFVLMKFIQFFSAYFYNQEKPPIIIGYFWATIMFVVSCAKFITFNQAFAFQYNMGYGIQSSLTTIIYEKALRLSPQSRRSKPTGDIINHITMDINMIFWFCWSIGEYIAAPMQLIICLISLYKLFRNATWAGVLTAAIVAPIASIANTSVVKYYLQEMKDKDDRTSLITEILNSAKSIKLYSWEKPMLERLNHIRNDRELYNIKKCGVISAFAQFMWSCIPFFISCATYGTYSYFYSAPLTPDIVFPALALFDLLSEPMFIIPRFIVSVLQTSTSLSRLGEMLCLDELTDDQQGHIKRSLEARDNSEYSVIIKDTTFVWDNSTTNQSEYKDVEAAVQSGDTTTTTTTTNTALKDINFLARKGKLTCVVGKVGSGKSTLINAILGNVPIDIPQYSDINSSNKNPSVETFGSIAYCPQNPWILNGTIKENILFGFKYDSEFYRKTIIACQLVSDFKTLPDGDKTIVGEKGISLSGGQKARISLARAVYSRADIYLLDDVLSAVDAHVGKALIEQILSSDGIIGTRTKILATNSVPVLHNADDIYLLSKGVIVEHGNYENVMKADGELAKLIKEYGRELQDNETNNKEKENKKKEGGREVEEEEEEEEEEEKRLENRKPVDPTEATEVLVNEIVDTVGEENRGIVEQGVLRRASLVPYNHSYESDEDETTSNSPRKTGHTEEESRKGTVPWDIFKQYIVACNYKYFALYILGTLLTLLISVAEKYLLSYWSGLNREENRTVDPVFFLGVYALMGVVTGLITYIAAYVIWGYCIVKGSAYFHNKMAQSVLRSPMSFFETTPVGRILNRFTEDIGKIDMNLPWMLIAFVSTVLNGLVTFGVIFFSLPIMFFVILGLLVVYNHFRIRFVPTTRELKRLESVAKSPILATIQESINGVDTIKAFFQTERFSHKSKKFIDDKTLIGIVSQNCNRWLSMRLQFIASSIMFSTGLLAVVSLGGKHPISPNILGFIMTYSLSITYILNALVRCWAEMQSEGVAIERIIEYCDLPSEAPMVIEDKRPDKSWPSKGVIKFKRYSTAYRDYLDPVLKEIELTINSREKIGIVGRTGAGKSSLTLALFRIIEGTGGKIEIDDINIDEIGLYDLRHHLTIIPQEAHTFRASVRENLDPFSEYDDDKLWKALEFAHLKEHVEQMESEPTEEDKRNSNNKNADELPKKRGLDAKIEEGGTNLSSGQKQLLCLARALLNETSKILVLDEATAAVDFQTDKIIQETIREQFKNKTILTIAHRIDTIMDSDKILVLDNGKVAEFDTPQNLLKNKKSIFYSLSKEGGYIT